MNIRKTILQKVDNLQEFLIATTQELVRIPSINHPPSGEEYACQMAVARHYTLMGYSPEIYSLDEVPGFHSHPSFWSGRDYHNRPNVVLRRKGTGGGRSLVLSGHIDTVPLGLQPWKHDPFGAEIEDGKLFGLGAYDMKSGVVLILGVMRTLQELDVALRGDLIAETVVDEEFGGVNGTLAGRLRGDNGDAMVITEPSDLKIYNGVQGGRVAHITLKGSEGILFEGGESGIAIRQLSILLSWIEIFRQRRREHIPNWSHQAYDPVPVWVTKVSAGGWGWEVPVTVPAEVKLELYWQLLPGEEQAQVDHEFNSWLAEMVAHNQEVFQTPPLIEYPIRFMPASEIPADTPLIQVLKSCAKEVTGQLPTVQPLPAPSDMYLVQRDFGIPAVHYGVRGGGAHAADEYMVVEDLVAATKVLTLFTLDWCGVA